MPSSTDHPWMTLCANYSVSAEASVTALLLDANVLLDNAQGHGAYAQPKPSP